MPRRNPGMCTRTLRLAQTSPYGYCCSTLSTPSAFTTNNNLLSTHTNPRANVLAFHPSKKNRPLFYRHVRRNIFYCSTYPSNVPKCGHIYHHRLPILCRFTDPLSCFDVIVYTGRRPGRHHNEKVMAHWPANVKDDTTNCHINHRSLRRDGKPVSVLTQRIDPEWIDWRELIFNVARGHEGDGEPECICCPASAGLTPKTLHSRRRGDGRCN